MISFKIVEKAKIGKEKFTNCGIEKKKLLELLNIWGEGNVAIARGISETLIRIFDGEEYFFICPSLEIDSAKEIAEYAVKEEIGLRFSRVTADGLSRLLGIFSYADVRLTDPEERLFSVRIRSEADLLSRIPRIKSGKMSLCKITRKDITDYAAVCREETGLKYWGYDYREDEPDASDDYFFKTQRSEFMRGVCLTFGVRYCGKLIGEAALYAFDYKGGCELSFRILPEYRGKGHGRETLEMLFMAAEEVGLTALYATVDKRNEASLALISQYMDKDSETDGRVRFVLCGQ